MISGTSSTNRDWSTWRIKMPDKSIKKIGKDYLGNCWESMNSTFFVEDKPKRRSYQSDSSRLLISVNLWQLERWWCVSVMWNHILWLLATIVTLVVSSYIKQFKESILTPKQSVRVTNANKTTFEANSSSIIQPVSLWPSKRSRFKNWQNNYRKEPFLGHSQSKSKVSPT